MAKSATGTRRNARDVAQQKLDAARNRVKVNEEKTAKLERELEATKAEKSSLQAQADYLAQNPLLGQPPLDSSQGDDAPAQ